MDPIKEQLSNLEEDGKLYAHFFSHPAHPEYYGIIVRERTPEFMRLWLTQGPLLGYSLALSIEMADSSFRDYMLETFTDQVEVAFLKSLCRIEDLDKETEWLEGFKSWKQEKIRLKREKFLRSYRGELKGQEALVKQSNT